MKDPRLSLPPEVAPLVASATRVPDPPEGARDRLRARLDWAFIESGPTKVVHASGHPPLHAVAPSAGHTVRSDRWFLSLARAAAAMILGHVPLALASLGIAIAAVPVSRVLLGRAADGRAAAHQPAAADRRVARPARATAPTQTPAILVLPSLAPLPTPFPAQGPTGLPPQSAVPSSAPRVAIPSPSEAPSDDLTLAAERQLLEQARRALVRGDAIGAVASLNEHAARYPISQLAEERAALSIQALFRSGRVGEARQRGLEFRRQFPSSLLLPALDAALHEEPAVPKGR